MKSQMEDYYKTLGVSKTASQAEIKKAYRKLAQKHHPDLAEDKDSAKAEFQKLQQAYDVLKDPEKRRMYDQFGPDYERMGGGGNPFGGGFGGGRGRQGGQHPDIDFSQFFGGGAGAAGPGPGAGGGFSFEDIFRQFGGAGQGGRGGRRPAATKGSDARASVTVPFQTAVLGGETSVGIRRGSQSQTIKVKIPAGISSGKKIRLRGQGEPSASGGEPGDLLLEVKVADHPHYRRQGNNLLLVLPISVWEATHGAKVDVPTPKGTVTVTVPPASSGGKKLRLRGLGITDKSGSGDLVIELSVRIPDNITEADQKLIDQLSASWKDISDRQDISW